MAKVQKLIFNHFYKLKHDLKRSYIFSPDSIRHRVDKNIHPGMISMIHPVYAMIFSFFSNPITLDDAVEQISVFLELPKKYIRKMLVSIVNKEGFTSCEYGGINNVFPPNIIFDVEYSFANIVQYTPSQFVYKELDFKRQKLYKSPIGILFMVNNQCATDCVYCYADKNVKTHLLTFDRIKAIIKNAYEAGVLNFMITGGEIFLYRQWRELLYELIKYNYIPSLLSTKLPLKEEEIDSIKEYNIPIQISLDSINNKNLKKILNTNDNYCEKIKHTIFLLEQKGVRFQVATILTQYNDDLKILEEMHDFLSNFKNIMRWEIRVAFKSLYSRKNFNDIKISMDTENRVENWIINKKKITNLNILWSPSGSNSRYFKCEGGSKNFVGPRCSANYSHMVILPDGKVSICEQLYWNPRFIIGDVSVQSIEDVWNSARALELAFPKRTDFRDESVCKKCSIFTECFSYPNKCFADVLKGYGDINWDYPDPRCKDAPEFIYDLTNS